MTGLGLGSSEEGSRQDLLKIDEEERNQSQSFLFFHKQRSGAEVFRSSPFELVFFHSSDP